MFIKESIMQKYYLLYFKYLVSHINMGAILSDSKEMIENAVLSNNYISNDDENLLIETQTNEKVFKLTHENIRNVLKNLIRFEILSLKFFKNLKEDIDYFTIRNILDNHNFDLIFVKVINMKSQLIKYTKFNRKKLKELMILEFCQARFINKPLGYFTSPDSKIIVILYEYFEVRLHDLIKNRGLGPMFNKMILLKNLIDILILLHSKGIISCDISPLSIGFSKANDIKLLTLGNSIKIDDENYDILRESIFDKQFYNFFVAPEIILKKVNRIKSIWSIDIWSLGILSYVMFREDYMEFYESTDTVLYTGSESEFNEIFDIKKIGNPYLKALISAMTKVETSDRPNIFVVADNFNHICKKLELDEKYNVVYDSKDVLNFVKFFDKSAYDLLSDK